MNAVEIANRYILLQQIRSELGESEQTENLIDYIEELWETIDLLKKRFGEKRAQEIINTPAPFTYSDED